MEQKTKRLQRQWAGKNYWIVLVVHENGAVLAVNVEVDGLPSRVVDHDVSFESEAQAVDAADAVAKALITQ